MGSLKVWLAAGTVLLTVGCNRGPSPEEVKAANRHARKGETAELQALLAEKPSIANAVSSRDAGLLEIVVDTRPAFPRYLTTIEILLQAGADPNEDAPEILRKAIWRGDAETFELLLKYGADPTIVSPKKKMNMLQYARSKNDSRLDAIADAWEREKTAVE